MANSVLMRGEAQRPHTVLVWLVVTILTSSAAILTRYCHIPATSIGFWRVLGAALVLLPWWLQLRRQEPARDALALRAILPGIFLGLHFASWAWALQHTTIANAMLFIGLQPLMAPLVARPLLGERLTRWEGAACALACLGMVWILGRQLGGGREQLPGTLVALGSAFLCACYFVPHAQYRNGQMPSDSSRASSKLSANSDQPALPPKREIQRGVGHHEQVHPTLRHGTKHTPDHRYTTCIAFSWSSFPCVRTFSRRQQNGTGVSQLGEPIGFRNELHSPEPVIPRPNHSRHDGVIVRQASRSWPRAARRVCNVQMRNRRQVRENVAATVLAHTVHVVEIVDQLELR